MGIPVLPFKGMAYALMFERGGPTRAMADTDLLVPEGRYEEACDCVQELGYVELEMGPGGPKLHSHERAFTKGKLMVEVHRGFLPGKRVDFDYEGIWSRVRSAGEECRDCVLMGAEDSLVYHCFHMGMHEYVHGLRPVWELRRLLLLDKPDLAVCAERAGRWGVRSMLWCAMRLLETCFPGTMESRDLERFKPFAPRAALLERAVVQPSLALLEKPDMLPRSVQLFRKALLVDRPVASLGYLFEWCRAGLFSRF